MRLAVVSVAAYLLTGVYYVCRDMSEKNVVRQVGYIGRFHRDRRFLPLVWIGLFWLPATVISLYVDHLFRRGLSVLFLFLVALVVIWRETQ